ncbi:NIN-like protein [Artemisia annua]|uniref:NIN-like protein n=1 Tax=Artemisia annua TaxID=35608 RepID=A0A2U1KYU3_ARTAN|nr:NIN-like protein [Artemisia annua]
MSTGDLPYYIQDMSRWEFHVACTEQHQEVSRGVVGRSLLSCSSCFCKDTIQLAAECVVELFLPTRSTNKADLQSLVKTVNQQNAFQLAILSSIQEIAFSYNSGAVGTSHGDVLYLEKVITHRKRRRSESLISWEEIKKHFGKPIGEVAAILHGSECLLQDLSSVFGRSPRTNIQERDDLTIHWL